MGLLISSAMKKIILLAILLLPIYCMAQRSITGSVFSGNDNMPLPGATIASIPSGRAITSNVNGLFTLTADSADHSIVASYVGFVTDTFKLTENNSLSIVLQPGQNLQTVVVDGNGQTTRISGINPIKTQIMTEKELGKAACCNLSESFETNPSVDVNYSDAVTGTRQIQMLGLSGIYSPVQLENIPFARASVANYGLNLIPGSWIESIQVSKGAGSVVNGYESTTGLINVELKKPEESERLYLNGYLNSMLRSEGNLNLAQRVSKDSAWHTGLLLHFDGWQSEIDMNKDGFMDMPLSNNYGLINRWKYQGKNGFESMFGVKAFYDRRTGGQLGYRPKEDKFSTQKWGFDMLTKRIELFAKNGYVFGNENESSIGTIISVLYHNQKNIFGQRVLNMDQRSIYGNFIFQSNINSDAHTYKTGLSFVYDHINETFINQPYFREEIVPGAFFEYTYNKDDRFVVVTGGRADYHNLFGMFFTPRIHAKYNLTELLVLRMSVGKSQRTAGIFAENMGLLANSRQWIIMGSGGQAYGLQPEVAWNYGANLTWGFFVNQNPATLSIDAYRTDFTNQIVADMDHSAQQVLFYNLVGQSYSNSAQIQLDIEPVSRLQFRLAYRYFDVKTQYTTGLLDKPFVAKHRAFVNIGYETENKKWRFDFTAQWFGAKRIPSTLSNPETAQMPSQSPSYFMFNAQVSRTFNKWEVYLGGENLSNFSQQNLIVDAANPFGQLFDASLVWGPTMGRMFYAGFRFKIN